MSVAEHLGIKTSEYDAQILTFIPYYDEILDNAAAALDALDRPARMMVDLGTGVGGTGGTVPEAAERRARHRHRQRRPDAGDGVAPAGPGADAAGRQLRGRADSALRRRDGVVLAAPHHDAGGQGARVPQGVSRPGAGRAAHRRRLRHRCEPASAEKGHGRRGTRTSPRRMARPAPPGSFAPGPAKTPTSRWSRRPRCSSRGLRGGRAVEARLVRGDRRRESAAANAASAPAFLTAGQAAVAYNRARVSNFWEVFDAATRRFRQQHRRRSPAQGAASSASPIASCDTMAEAVAQWLTGQGIAVRRPVRDPRRQRRPLVRRLPRDAPHRRRGRAARHQLLGGAGGRRCWRRRARACCSAGRGCCRWPARPTAAAPLPAGVDVRRPDAADSAGVASVDGILAASRRRAAAAAARRPPAMRR